MHCIASRCQNGAMKISSPTVPLTHANKHTCPSMGYSPAPETLRQHCSRLSISNRSARLTSLPSISLDLCYYFAAALGTFQALTVQSQ
ncbi:hypothetical protein HZ326_25993 [Fusarium oxysporum f. sp. albedinis]|nr:hypothetical protein HZ326_25993 [Fusarium oxysporum f. sp. albedinis]